MNPRSNPTLPVHHTGYRSSSDNRNGDSRSSAREEDTSEKAVAKDPELEAKEANAVRVNEHALDDQWNGIPSAGLPEPNGHPNHVEDSSSTTPQHTGSPATPVETKTGEQHDVETNSIGSLSLDLDHQQDSTLSPSLLSTDPITDDSLLISRTARIKLVRIKRPGRRTSRIGVKVIRPKPIPDSEFLLEPVTSNVSQEVTESLPEPPPGFQHDFATTFGTDALERLESAAKLHSSSGQHLPIQLRDLFPALSDPASALGIANALRAEQDLPHLMASKATRIALRRVVALVREKLYVELVSALTLPLAPVSMGNEGEEAIDTEKPDLSMTPTNLDILSRTLPKAFPHDKAAIKAFLAGEHEEAYGEKEGKVVWQGGVGRMLGGAGVGFREKAIQDGPVHIFVDQYVPPLNWLSGCADGLSSNILYGLLHSLYSDNSTSLPPRHLRTLSLPALSLLLRRGRPTPPGTLHLVASSPLKQNLDPLVRLGWEVSILKRVEIFSDEVQDATAMTLVPRPQARISGAGDVGVRRYKEQGVDEILHLKLLQALNGQGGGSAPAAARLVLATGDVKGGQFNRDGFVGGVREALRRGWAVELWSFRSGASSSFAHPPLSFQGTVAEARIVQGYRKLGRTLRVGKGGMNKGSRLGRWMNGRNSWWRSLRMQTSSRVDEASCGQSSGKSFHTVIRTMGCRCIIIDQGVKRGSKQAGGSEAFAFRAAESRKPLSRLAYQDDVAR